VSGAALPLAIGIDRARNASRSTGDLYAANTLGAILGSWAGGFLLLPLLGLRGGIELAALLPILVSAALLARRASLRSRATAGALVAGAAVLVLLLPDWNRAALTRGGFAIGVEQRKSGRTGLAPDRTELVFLEEGITSTITVRRFRDELTMQMNGVTEASNSGDFATQIMAGALPALLHANPRDAMVIGLGSGITTSAVARVPGMQSVDCLEISEAVVNAARLFHESNRDVLDDPRVRTIVGDGRNHLRLSGRRYDVVVSEPSNVWNSGIGSLMTSEFFQLARQSLRPGGVLGSWIQGYSLSPDALRSVLAAAGTAFPRVSLWTGGWGDLLIVAGDESFEFDVARLLERGKDPAFGELLREMDCPDLMSLLSHNLLAGDAVARYVTTMTPNTDDNNYLEFQAPRLLYRETMSELFDGLHAAAGGTEAWMTGGPAEVLAPELPRLRRARALESAARLALRDARGSEGLAALEEAHRLHPTAPAIARLYAQALVSRGTALRRQDDPTEAARLYLRAAEVDARSGDAFAELAETYLDAGQPDAAIHAVDEALRREPGDPEFRAIRARLFVRARAFEDAAREARAALADDPWVHDAYETLGEALEGMGRPAEADSAYRAGLDRFPDSPELAAKSRKLSASAAGES
jgi:spermidine synthase